MAVLVRFAAVLVAALSLGLSFAHALEARPRLSVWSPDLWRQATVFGGEYTLFGAVGGPLDIAVIPLAAAVAWMARRDRSGVWPAVIAMGLFAISLAVWLAVVAPANEVMAGWRPGPLAADFEAIRRRWETGHVVMAVLKLGGFVGLALSALTRPDRMRAGYRS